MITLEIVFSANVIGFSPPVSSIGMESDDSMKSDKSPSRWEQKVFSPMSGKIVHIFDRKFVGCRGYRALYDDIIDEGDRIEFKSPMKEEFIELIKYCLDLSSDGRLFLCADMQYGPIEKMYKPISFSKFVARFMRFGIRNNSCVEVFLNNN